MLPAFCTLPLSDFDLRATHARTLLPAALASVSFGFVLVRVRLRILLHAASSLERHSLRLRPPRLRIARHFRTRQEKI